jgi:ABC-type Fe3+ transport system permease subunit
MAKFDWIPYLEGKYLTYYQWFAVIGSTALLALSLLSFVLYLLLCRIKTRRDRLQGMQNIHQEGNRLHALKEWFLSLGFVFFSMIPLICAALDVLYLFEGAIGMAAILILMVYVRNGTKQYEHVSSFEHANTFVRKALHLGSSAKKQIIKMIVIAILANLFLYKTCLCFYNSEIGYYN